MSGETGSVNSQIPKFELKRSEFEEALKGLDLDADGRVGASDTRMAGQLFDYFDHDDDGTISSTDVPEVRQLGVKDPLPQPSEAIQVLREVVSATPQTNPAAVAELEVMVRRNDLRLIHARLTALDSRGYLDFYWKANSPLDRSKVYQTLLSVPESTELVEIALDLYEKTKRAAVPKPSLSTHFHANVYDRVRSWPGSTHSAKVLELKPFDRASLPEKVQEVVEALGKPETHFVGLGEVHADPVAAVVARQVVVENPRSIGFIAVEFDEAFDALLLAAQKEYEQNNWDTEQTKVAELRRKFRRLAMNMGEDGRPIVQRKIFTLQHYAPSAPLRTFRVHEELFVVATQNGVPYRCVDMMDPNDGQDRDLIILSNIESYRTTGNHEGPVLYVGGIRHLAGTKLASSSVLDVGAFSLRMLMEMRTTLPKDKDPRELSHGEIEEAYQSFEKNGFKAVPGFVAVNVTGMSLIHQSPDSE